MKRKGKVSKIGKSQYSYYIMLDGDNFYFNTKYEPKCGVGDTVGIEFDKKGDNRGQIKKVVTLEDAGGPKGVQNSGGGGRSSGGRSYGGNDDDRQASIIYQSSRKDALVLAELILSNGGIKLPKGEDAARTVIEELVDEITVRFVKDATDPAKACKSAKEAEEDSSDDWDDSSNDDGDEWSDDADWE